MVTVLVLWSFSAAAAQQYVRTVIVDLHRTNHHTIISRGIRKWVMVPRRRGTRPRALNEALNGEIKNLIVGKEGGELQNNVDGWKGSRSNVHEGTGPSPGSKHKLAGETKP